jgi:hypothetical protein
MSWNPTRSCYLAPCSAEHWNKPLTFCSSSSHPVTFSGLPKDRFDELLGLLLTSIFNNFRACSRPEDYLARAAEKTNKSEIKEQKVILVGASNMYRASRYFADSELSFENHSVPGWTPTADNFKTLSDMVEEKTNDCAAFAFDILSNSAVRFEQFDGSTALPFKSNGTFHLGGRVTSTPIGTLKKVIEHVLPILKAKGNKACIIIPPLPRYLFSRCCNDKSHCTNTEEKDFPEKLLSGFIQQRNELIKSLVQNGLTNFKVLDACCVTMCATTASISDRLNELRNVAAGDGVHFNANGYQNLAQRTISCLRSIMTEKPKSARKHTFFRRGYRSMHGSMATSATRLTLAPGGRGGCSPW